MPSLGGAGVFLSIALPPYAIWFFSGLFGALFRSARLMARLPRETAPLAIDDQLALTAISPHEVLAALYRLELPGLLLRIAVGIIFFGALMFQITLAGSLFAGYQIGLEPLALAVFALPKLLPACVAGALATLNLLNISVLLGRGQHSRVLLYCWAALCCLFQAALVVATVRLLFSGNPGFAYDRLPLGFELEAQALLASLAVAFTLLILWLATRGPGARATLAIALPGLGAIAAAVLTLLPDIRGYAMSPGIYLADLRRIATAVVFWGIGAALPLNPLASYGILSPVEPGITSLAALILLLAAQLIIAVITTQAAIEALRRSGLHGST